MKHMIFCYGGGGAGLALYPQVVTAQLNAADVTSEIAKLSPPAEVGTYGMGADETVLSIARALNSNALLDYAETAGNSSADDGADASRLFADAIARFEVEHGGFREFVAARRNALVIEGGGNFDRIETTAVGGSGGGVGGGALRRLDRAVAQAWIVGGYGVHRHRVRIGPKTHTRTAEDGLHNEQIAAATCCEDLYDFMVTPELSAHETRELTFVELPLCNSDEAARNYYAATCGQALFCSALRKRLMAYKVNGKNKLKRVTVAQVSWFAVIPEMEIWQAAEEFYVEKLDETLKHPASHRLAELHIDYQHEPVDGVSISDVVEQAARSQISSNDLLGAALQSLGRVSADISARLSTGRRVEAKRLEEFLNSFDASFNAFLEMRSSVTALLLAATQKLKGAQVESDAARARLEFHKLRCRRVLTWSFGRGGMCSRLLSAAQLLSKKKPRLKRALESLKQVAEDFAKAKATTEGLKTLEHRLREEMVRIEAVLEKIKRSLLAFKSVTRTTHVPCEFKPLEQAWSALILLDETTYLENGKRLTGLVRCVTGHGLKKILGASDHNVSSIVAALKTKAPVVEGPHWGGKVTRHYGTTLYVLPPASDSLRQAFQSHQDRDVEVLFADGAAAGVTVVRLKLCTPTEMSKGGLLEIFTRSFRERLSETIQEDVRQDFYPQGNEAWVWLKDKLFAANETVDAKDGDNSADGNTPSAEQADAIDNHPAKEATDDNVHNPSHFPQ